MAGSHYTLGPYTPVDPLLLIISQSLDKLEAELSLDLSTRTVAVVLFVHRFCHNVNLEWVFMYQALPQFMGSNVKPKNCSCTEGGPGDKTSRVHYTAPHDCWCCVDRRYKWYMSCRLG